MARHQSTLLSLCVIHWSSMADLEVALISPCIHYMCWRSSRLMRLRRRRFRAYKYIHHHFMIAPCKNGPKQSWLPAAVFHVYCLRYVYLDSLTSYQGTHELLHDRRILGKTCGLLPLGVSSARISTQGLEWNLRMWSTFCVVTTDHWYRWRNHLTCRLLINIKSPCAGQCARHSASDDGCTYLLDRRAPARFASMNVHAGTHGSKSGNDEINRTICALHVHFSWRGLQFARFTCGTHVWSERRGRGWFRDPANSSEMKFSNNNQHTPVFIRGRVQRLFLGDNEWEPS